MEALADATLVVQDVELPVHSQVLSLQSRVLLDMFTAVAPPAKEGATQPKVVLKEPFAGHELYDVALFLRFVYRPTDLTHANLATARGSLLGLLRLAHKLDVPQLMQAVGRQMSESLSSTVPQAELLAWAEAADQCCNSDLRLRCLTEVAHRLAQGSSDLASAFSSTAALANSCDHSTLSTLLGLLTHASGTDGASRLRAITPAAAVEALQASAGRGTFEWVVEHYSQLPCGVGRRTESPYFRVAASEWSFPIYPGGDKEAAAGHLSVFIKPKHGAVHARYSITAVDQGPTKLDWCLAPAEPQCFEAGSGWGYPKFMKAEALRSEFKGFLKGDRLVLRASVEVVTASAAAQAKAGGKKGSAAGSFDAEQPAAFYLLDSREGMEALADATLVVQDVKLPVHSQVLSLQSRVLLDMFTAVASQDDPQAASGSKAKVVLREPFAGYSLFEVSLFLRCAYRPADLTPANLDAVRGSLLGLLRLADQLDAPVVMHALAAYMGDCVGAAAAQTELLEWAEAAEQCCLPELKMRCLAEVAHRLARAGGSLASSFSATAGLAGCSQSTLSTLLSLLATGCGPAGAPRLLETTPAAAVEAQEASGNHGTFQWVVERYSRLSAVRGDFVYSPYFQAAGMEWRFKIYPGGESQDSAGHLSAFLIPRHGGFNARYAICVVDQGPAKEDLHRQTETPKAFRPTPGAGQGWAKVARAAQLYGQANGYLKGDRLVLRASVEVTGHSINEEQQPQQAQQAQQPQRTD
ncbi:BTB POZ and MATH domain-containing 4-like [Chlorella sorokiniana]|uniref:BTB POZ and MATH domain-containing 4-like n=1 Tax=Chlorella sorokiniana TaxID=3076 RepID=A0A2P6TI63_CHLSO|nr:BTB POZ and MATH domain-containing 4-like [Chlorella sorokiniana]|eukprot:PRW33982.1 BTB POZ and MATH domain-containing 4-like [Chlorella sorokiniana]